MKRNNRQNILYEVSFKVNSEKKGAVALLRVMLVKSGVNSYDIVESSRKTISALSLFVASKEKAKALKKIISDSGVSAVIINIKKLKESSWRDKWKKDFHTFALTKGIDVVPDWQKRSYRTKARKPIFIDTTNAFGTGLHETTRFVANLIEQQKGKFSTFLDVGTGTGILSLVAYQSGARDIIAIDSDRACIKVARDNLRKNKCHAKAKVVDVAHFDINKRFDFVAANLITHDLIRLKRKIVSLVAPGGFLAISGVSLEHCSKVRSAFKMPLLRCIKVQKGKQWVAVLYQRKNRG